MNDELKPVWGAKAPSQLSIDELAAALDFVAEHSTVDDALGQALALELAARTATRSAA